MGICNSILIHESVRNEIIEIEHNTTQHQQIKLNIKKIALILEVQEV